VVTGGEGGRLAAKTVTGYNCAELEYVNLNIELKALIPNEAGLSEPMVAGKITILAPFVTGIGPIIVVAEGGTAGQLTVARKPGEGFTVTAANGASTDRINWMVFAE
jgi:hypothetical protein